MRKYLNLPLIILLAITSCIFTSCSKDDDANGNSYYPHVLKINDTTFKYHEADYTNIADGAFTLHETEDEYLYDDIVFYIKNEKGRPVFDPATEIKTGENIIDNYTVSLEYAGDDESYKSVSGIMKITNNTDKTVTLELQDATFEYDDHIIDGNDTPVFGETIKVNGKITFTKFLL